eukprot:TRINITY_DN25775_c0_g2_i1.p2 TRINITY_DN25775_c0_g2~~TRINITY_DN25775_c0_g2_i1.p2  ORF type:complete len:171 (+),score=38.03 TRINITY_DN25775_c0_g2_i1:902-1414(+)
MRRGEPLTQILVVSWLVPGFNLAFYFELKPQEDQDPRTDHFYKMLQHFMAPGNDVFRSKRLKFIPHVADGPWLVRKGVGSTPAILGNKLEMKHFHGDQYTEIDVDVCSSAVAARIMNMCKGAATSLVIDMAFVMEGKKEDELPERVLGAVRIHNCDLGAVAEAGDPTLHS